MNTAAGETVEVINYKVDGKPNKLMEPPIYLKGEIIEMIVN